MNTNKMAAGLRGIFEIVFFNEKFPIPFKITLKLLPKFPIDKESVLLHVEVWHRSEDKLSPQPKVIIIYVYSLWRYIETSLLV